MYCGCKMNWEVTLGLNRERLSVTNLSSENNFANVLTECSSRHQGKKLWGCLMQLVFNIKANLYYHCLSSLSATRATTLWLKQPTYFCSDAWCLVFISGMGRWHTG